LCSKAAVKFNLVSILGMNGVAFSYSFQSRGFELEGEGKLGPASRWIRAKVTSKRKTSNSVSLHITLHTVFLGG